MSTQLIICIIIFVMTLVSYILNKVPMWITSIGSMLLLVLTGCLKSASALSGFSNPNTILMAGMFVVAAGLRKTTFVKALCSFIMRITNGSFTKAYFGYIIITALLSNFISSPMVVFAIVAPLIAELCDECGVSPSKVMFPIGVVAIGCTMVLPTDAAITQASQNNAFLATYGMANYVIKPIDFFIAKWPILILLPAWALFLAPKFMPDQPNIPIKTISSKSDNVTGKELSPFSNSAGIIIFFGTILALLFSTQLGIENWIIACFGGVLMVLSKVLSSKDALDSLPLDMILLFVGSLALGSALSETGAGDVIGKWLSAAVGGTRNGYVIGALFFIVPFIVTQFMLNRAVIQIFTPICILACKALGANPVGPMILVTAGSLTAFLTPMATPAIPMVMAVGGYSLKDLFRGGWLITILMTAVYVFYVMTVYPAF
ncbi:SLC13 family permease [Tepidanaerobacter sp. EBM-38]|uniref:SLC13 family permease n=1 Tax=Tepidanaerobacter sp. EBM-38 TaxID=1918496 RepID=UPI000B31A25F|nr:SLC13 family permease [Tepidanaerobacter sp. EBM-38]